MIDPRQGSLFDATPADIELGPGARVLRGFALGEAERLFQAIQAIAEASPFRHLVTPGGQSMSAAMTNCGPLGWVSDRRGYRYEPNDPLSGRPWPAMPALFLELAGRAAAATGFADFHPDAGLINRYVAGARMGLHQDRDEASELWPIVSVSLGLPAIFVWGRATRGGPAARIPLFHGDVVCWGGASRYVFHGVDPVKDGVHPLTGAARYNLTFRRAR